MTIDERTTMNGKPVLRVPVKTVLNLKSGFEEKLLCDGPALSLGDACAYSCEFCYVPAIYQKLDRVRHALEAAGKQHHEVVILREGGLEVLRDQLLHPPAPTALGEVSRKRKFPDPEDRRVVYSSPADDVAANLDLVLQTIEACKLILWNTNWRIRLLSKSPLLTRIAGDLDTWASRNDSMDPDTIRQRVIFGFSTGTLQDDLAAAIESGTPLVSKRINALHVLQDNGFRTYAMVCPSLPQEGMMAYEAEASHAAQLLRYDRCEHVWAEAINLRGDSFKRTIVALRAKGFERAATRLAHVSTDPDAWEEYNRNTYLAHMHQCSGMVGKLRYLTYTKPSTLRWWQGQIFGGAVLLGNHA